MLPHFARIALNEHTPNIIGQQVGRICGGNAVLWFHPNATEGVATRGGQTRVVLLPTETAGDLLLFILLRILIVILAMRSIIVTTGALALARMWEVGS
jgi:hypothetical protein